MTRIHLNELAKIREKHKNEKIVFCSGCFDLTHAGHLLFFEDCKKHGDVLVVMVGADAVVKRDKGDTRPILNEHVRLKLVDNLKPVDYTMIDELIPSEGHQLKYIDMIFEHLRPDTYVINQDAFDIPFRQAFSDKHGVKLVVLERSAPKEFEKISTSGIIKKIKALE